MEENKDIEKLDNLLLVAAQHLARIDGPIYSTFSSGAEMAAFVLACRDSLAHGQLTQIQKRELWKFFAPTSEWDDVDGDVALGNEIYSLVNKLYRSDIAEYL
jgi:hypothetical protein